MINKTLFLVIAIVLLLISCEVHEPYKCEKLTIDYRSESICVEGDAYRLGWAAPQAPGKSQTHYQIQVATDSTFQSKAVIFDSDKKASSASQNLVKAIHNSNDHIYSGFIGIKPIMESLVEAGDKQLAFDMIMQEQSPGWLHMVKDEYSTMGENMNAEGYGTGHHPFGTNIGYWFYRHILGLRAHQNGWQEMIIEPFLPSQLYSASGTVVTPYGDCSVSISRSKDLTTYDIKIPFNTTAKFKIPGEMIQSTQEYTLDKSGRIDLPAGTYTFTSKI